MNDSMNLKFDGHRMLCCVDCHRVLFGAGKGEDWTDKFRNVIEAVKLSAEVVTLTLCRYVIWFAMTVFV
jgi:ATP-dependent DNA ligase